MLLESHRSLLDCGGRQELDNGALGITLALGFFFLQMKWRIVLSRSVKICVGLLMGIALNLWIVFSRKAIFTINISDP